MEKVSIIISNFEIVFVYFCFIAYTFVYGQVETS